MKTESCSGSYSSLPTRTGCFGKWFSSGVHSLGCEISTSRKTVADDGLMSMVPSWCHWGCTFQVNLKQLTLRKGILENRYPAEMGRWRCLTPLRRHTCLGTVSRNPQLYSHTWETKLIEPHLLSDIIKSHRVPSFTWLRKMESSVGEEGFLHPPEPPHSTLNLPKACSLSHPSPNNPYMEPHWWSSCKVRV